MSNESDEDRAWSEIVAGYERDATDPVPRWPVSEDLSEDDPESGTDSTTDSDDSDGSDGPDEAAELVAALDGARAGAGSRLDEAQPEEGEDFVPPDPPPLPALDPVTKAAWVALLAGPALFILVAITKVRLPSFLLAAAIAASIGGFIALITRMRSGPPDDDGAVV